MNHGCGLSGVYTVDFLIMHTVGSLKIQCIMRIMHYEHAFWQVQNHTSLDFPSKTYALSNITLCIMRKSTVCQ
ncbi:hypothetical protein PAXRUDRAFT_457370 [Paxillus rubicundulus Ve08.2h10]|uniref:Uncharacterized protein n=1 Tax=Paxillus rubicundulus Ve08.2h10 TaxID=930991 RepID=A0A0D0D709_9AGAM|nr:hypothetical protein PAXRUDRAFT_457370 [Paxillus rubicundulus Ve08.2h10]